MNRYHPFQFLSTEIIDGIKQDYPNRNITPENAFKLQDLPLEANFYICDFSCANFLRVLGNVFNFQFINIFKFPPPLSSTILIIFYFFLCMFSKTIKCIEIYFMS